MARKKAEQVVEQPAVSEISLTNKEHRMYAFRSEADHLFFKQQRGEVPVGTWEAKCQEIKDRWPD